MEITLGVSDPNRLGASDLLASRDCMKSLKVHPSPMAFNGCLQLAGPHWSTSWHLWLDNISRSIAALASRWSAFQMGRIKRLVLHVKPRICCVVHFVCYHYLTCFSLRDQKVNWTADFGAPPRPLLTCHMSLKGPGPRSLDLGVFWASSLATPKK